ncbi:MAG: serine hydrolase domain-containing protein [Gemmatimonadales bacterium]
MLLPLIATCLLAQNVRLDNAIARIDSVISSRVAAGFSGAVLIARGDTVLLDKAYGRADTGPGASPPAFWLASDSKQFTATAILRLEQTGHLRVTDSLIRFFPDAPADKRAITIHQLLTHTSGLPHESAADGIADRATAVRTILKLRLKSKPGEKYSYSNDGYNLLAAIIDMSSVAGFDRFIQDSLFTRAGMSRSGIWGNEKDDAGIAPLADPRRGTKMSPSIFREGHGVSNWGYRGPTGAYSTTRDVYRWIQALRRGEIIDETEKRELLGRHVLVNRDALGESYTGYGWGVRVEGGHDVSYGHAGNEDWLGHNAIIRFAPDGLVVVVLSNAGDKDNTGWSSLINHEIRHVMDAPQR